MLFDLDRTLVDSSEAATKAVEKVLGSRGLKCDRGDILNDRRARENISARCGSDSLH